MGTPNHTGRPPHESDYGDALSKALRHKEALFSMAQILTLDSSRAIQLVEKTYERALSAPAISQIDIQDRRYMLQLLIELHKESANATNSLFAPSAVSSNPTDIKDHIIQDALKTLMPLAFASLEDADRILLILCNIEQLSCADASLILGSDSETVCERLDYARNHLKSVVLRNAPPALVRFLTENYSDSWVSSALQNSLKSTYKAPPAKLESAIRGALSRKKNRAPSHRFAQTQRPDGTIQSPNSIGNRTVRLVITLVLIISAGLAGYIGSEMLQTAPDANLISLSARKAKRIKPILTTSDRNEAQQFIVNHLDWRLNLPKIDGSIIKGVGISEIVSGVRVPVFLYEDESEGNTNVTVYAITYALLDEFQNQIELSQETLTAISDQDHIDKYELSSGSNVFVWRNADDIFLAVASEGELRNRIQVQ